MNDKLNMMKFASPAFPTVEIDAEDDANGGMKCSLTCDVTCTQTCGTTKVG